MSEWAYIGIAYALTWATLLTYGIHLARQRARAVHGYEAGASEERMQ